MSSPDKRQPASANGPGLDESTTLRAIGTIETPFKTLADCPRNGRQIDPAPLCRVRVFADYVPGLAGLAGFSHLILLYWLHRPGRHFRLRFVPPFDTAERGLFATRAPVRPNPIGLAVVAFNGLEGADTLGVRYLDCLDGTPLLDIKPYLPTTDAVHDASMGWLASHAAR
ncbi:MAG: tRNA (N6-threonylcarbamoyladenosine(37)-N6)-methyltransferase TrmO [Acetobacteraceae bacterium]|nr:tRNA (N6-threonylcarbamoyladenosine(37)-N6)-methyltransferase TrmO [Acetobacteraceae bacterium]